MCVSKEDEKEEEWVLEVQWCWRVAWSFVGV